MSTAETNKPQTFTAAQRLEGLERGVSMMDQTIGNLSSRLNYASSAIVALNDRIEALIKALETNVSVSKASVDTLIVEGQVEDLKRKVADLIEKGYLERSEVVSPQSFVVGRELDQTTGVVVNPRIQYSVEVMTEEAKVAILGKKVGETVNANGGNIVVEIEEVYQIIEPKLAQENIAAQPAEL